MIRLALILTAALAVTPASAFTARNGMQVAQTANGQIYVDDPAPVTETDYWCAAGDFVTRGLGLSSKTRVWRASPKPRKRAMGITFTLNEAEKAANGGISSFGGGKNDGSLSAGVATGVYCTPIVLFPDR